MEAVSSNAARRVQSPASHALVVVLVELVATACKSIASGLASLSAARRHAQLRRELQGMSDHFLKDVGLRRDQIDRMFR